MIDYPDDHALMRAAQVHDIPSDVLVRDLVRVVEVCNLLEKGFFNSRSVLSGSMALRSYGSPRFTVYDADFSTSKDTVHPQTQMTKMLSYEDDDLIISPAPLVPTTDGGGIWKSAPINFTPFFTDLIQPQACHFKADVSFRGLIRDGVEAQLRVPYDLSLWREAPTIFVMDPVEVIAEKILGWCVYGLVKHYADLGYLALLSRHSGAGGLSLERDDLREAAADKLERMREIYPDHYDAFPDLESLVEKLERPPMIDARQWNDLLYLRKFRKTFKPSIIQSAVQNALAPLIK